MSINVHDEVFAICEKFDVVPEHVRRIELFPASATVEVYLIDANGSKYVDPLAGNVATESRTFDIATWKTSE